MTLFQITSFLLFEISGIGGNTMTRREFEKRVKDENLKMESYDIALDHYYDGHPHFMGCVKKMGNG